MVYLPLFTQSQAQDIVPTVGFKVEKFMSQRSVLNTLNIYFSVCYISCEVLSEMYLIMLRSQTLRSCLFHLTKQKLNLGYMPVFFLVLI